MTTATKTEAGKADQLAGLQEARERLEELRQERATRDQDAGAYTQGVMLARAELDRLVASEPEQFGGDGLPKPKTEAAKLKAKIEAAETSRWPAVMAGLDQRIHELEAEVRDLMRPVAVELARAEYEAGLEAKREVLVVRDQLLAAIGRVHATGPALTELANAARGLNGSHVAIDPRWHELEDLLRSIDEFEPARIPPMTPYTDEDPVIRRAADGAWMSVSSDPKAGWSDEQPEPVERPS
jgi:hypothetical protein